MRDGIGARVYVLGGVRGEGLLQRGGVDLLGSRRWTAANCRAPTAQNAMV